MLRTIVFIMLTVYCTDAETIINGNIREDQTWHAEGSPYVINKSIAIEKNVFLEIEKGTSIKAAPEAIIMVYGEIISNGSPAAPVQFTCSHPQGFWGGIYLNSGSEGKFEFTHFENAGRSSFTQNSMLLVRNSTAVFEFCKFSKPFLTGIKSIKGGQVDLGGGKFSGGFNTFEDFDVQRLAIMNESGNDLFAKFNCWNDDPQKLVLNKNITGSTTNIYTKPENSDCSPQPPGIPELFFPTDSSRDIPVNVNVKWHEVKFADRYEFLFADDESFRDTVLHEINEDTLYPAINLDYGNRYFWKVRAQNGIGKSDWSEVFNFITFDTTKPEKPVIVYPPDSLMHCNLRFEWEKFDNADSYDIKLFKKDFELDTALTQNYFKPKNLEFYTDYYFKVRGENRNGKGDWSDEKKIIRKPVFTKQNRGPRLSQLKNYESKTFSQGAFIAVSEDSMSIMLLKDNKIKAEYNFDNKVIDFVLIDNDMDNNSEAAVLTQSRLMIFNLAEKSFSLKRSFSKEYKFKAIITGNISEGYEHEILLLAEAGDFEKIMLLDMDLNLKAEYELTGRNELYSFRAIDNGCIQHALLDSNESKLKIYDLSDSLTLINRFDIDSESSIFTFDINIDGITDILKFGNNSELILSRNKNSFERYSAKLSDNIMPLTSIDITGDGFPELAASNGNDIIFYSFINNEFTEIDGLKNLAKEPLRAIVSDLNQDLSADIVLYGENPAEITINTCDEFFNPAKPENLRFNFTKNGIQLGWDRVNKRKVYYNIYLKNENGYYIANLNGKSSSKKFNRIANNLTSENSYLIRNLPPGNYIWAVEALSCNGVSSGFTEEKALYTKDRFPSPPQSWLFESKTGSNSTILMRPESKPSFMGDSLSLGDALGVFYNKGAGLKCGGYAVWQPGETMALTVWGENSLTKEKDGFLNGEGYRFKLWDASEQTIHKIAVRTESGSLHFVPDTLTVLNKLIKLDTAELVLEKNYWQMQTIPLQPYNAHIPSVLGKNIFIRNDNNNYYKHDKFDELEYFITTEGYEYFAEINDTVMLEGQKIESKNNQINIPPGKWHIMPYFFEDTISTASFFKFNRSSDLIMKDDRGRIFSPFLKINQIGSLIPGKAYKVFTFKNMFIRYSVVENNDPVAVEYKLPEEVSELSKNGNNMTLVLNTASLSEGKITVRDNNGVIRGLESVSRDTAVVSVYGDNELFESEINGLTVYFYDKNKQISKKVLLKEGFDILNDNPIAELTYRKDAVHYFKAGLISSRSLSAESDFIKVYPNPAKSFINIGNIGECQIVDIEIRNLTGKIISRNKYKNPAGSIIFNTEMLPEGVYFLRIKYNGKIADKKIILMNKINN